jgi:hypothetical protein
MPRPLLAFLASLLPVSLLAVLFVATVAFVSIPMSLNEHPGEPSLAHAGSTYHPS